jgi:AraC-like DNA-binding protein
VQISEASSFADRLSFVGQADAATSIGNWLEGLDRLRPVFDTIPNWFRDIRWPKGELEELFESLAEGDEQWGILYDAMFRLQGSTVKILRQDYNKRTVAITYRRSIPYNIEPVLIFDASGNVAMEYTFIAKNSCNLERLPSATKTYRNLTVRYFDFRAGQAAYRTKADIETLAAAAAEAAIGKPPGEEVLIIHRKGESAPAATLRPLILAKVRALGGDESKLRFLTWGCHRATNEFQRFEHVILIGLLQAPLSAIIAMIYGTSGKRMDMTVSRIDIEIMRMSRIIGDAIQAIGRGAVRQMTAEGDVPHGCTVDLIASSVGPMGFKDPLNTLANMFPGATVKPWFPNIPAAKQSKDMLIADAARSLLGDKPEALITSGEWASQAGYSARTLQRGINKGVVKALLVAQGIIACKQGQKWLIQREDGAERLAAA